MWESIAKEMELPWQAVEQIFLKFHNERTATRKSKRVKDKALELN